VTAASLIRQGADGRRQQLLLQEVGWHDLRPAMSGVGPFTRLARCGRLLLQAAHPRGRRPVPQQSRGLQRMARLSVVALGGWFALLLLAASKLAWDQAAPWLAASGAAPDALLPGWVKLAWIVVLGALSVPELTRAVDLSWTVFAFTTDRDQLRARLQRRLSGMLLRAAAPASHRRIVLLAHSFGSVVAVTTLAARPAAPLPPLTLVTLGSPLEFLAISDPSLPPAIEACLASTAVSRWIDVYATADGFCSRVPLPDGAGCGCFTAHEVSLPAPRLAAAFGRVHDAYFAHPDVLKAVLGSPGDAHDGTPSTTTPFPCPGGSAHAAPCPIASPP